MKHHTRPAVVLLLAVLVAFPARPEEGAAPPQLAEMTLEEFTEIHHQPNVLTVELRADAAIAAAMFPLARSPAAIAEDDISADCLAVLVIDDSSAAEEVAAAADRFLASGCGLFRLTGGAASWIEAGLAGPAAPRQSARPGEVRFVIPRGLCEAGEPVQVFE